MPNTLPVPMGGAELPDRPRAFTEALDAAEGYATAAKSAATRLAYRSDFRHFTAWCDANAARPMSASIETAAAYLAHVADAGLSVSTITRRAAAIGYAHRCAGHEPPTNAEPVKAVLRGIRRTLGTAPARKAPATAETIRAMLKRIPDTPRGKRDRALLLIGFAGALRRSELVALCVEDIERAPDGILVRIGKSKTDQEGRGHLVAIPRGTRLRPVEALEAWLAEAGITSGRIFALTAQSVALVVKRYVETAGLDPELFAGHSLRAGLVTTVLDAGADVFKVMEITRHKRVETLKIYDRRSKFKNHAGRKFL